MRRVAVITGASRGMGLAMAQQLLDAGWHLLCIARKPDASLEARATASGGSCVQWALDLAEPAPAAARLSAWLQSRDAEPIGEVVLINNAAVVGRIAPLRDIAPADLADAMRINLEAPLLLTAAFLQATEGWKARRKVLNISSGLGRRAMAASAAYCAAKAGMDHFTRCVALEEAGKPHGARLCALAPGVIDTDMQVQLRGADASQFPDIGSFIGMKEKGALSSPQQAAAQVLAFLARPEFGSKPVGLACSARQN